MAAGRLMRQAKKKRRDAVSKTKREHKTGYHVWIYDEKFWHRSINGAERRSAQAQNYCHNVQIIEVSTGQLVGGRPE